MSLYALILFAHSLLRWLVLLLILVVCVRSFVGWLRRRGWLPVDERLHAALVGVVDLQFLLGLILYAFLSPFSRAFWLGLPTSMKDPVVRFYGVEHLVAMLIGGALLHIGRKKSTQATDARRHRIVFISTIVALLIILAAIPWPERVYGRPLFRPLW